MTARILLVVAAMFALAMLMACGGGGSANENGKDDAPDIVTPEPKTAHITDPTCPSEACK